MSSSRTKLAKSSSSTVLVYKDISLKLQDVQLLQGPHWINDQIIAFYFEYLENETLSAEERRKILLVSPQVTQCLKIAPQSESETFLEPLKAKYKKYIIFPLNNNGEDKAGGTHWSLLVFSRSERVFYCFDSLSSLNDRVAEEMSGILKTALNCPSAQFVKKTSRQQSNTYDCGIYILCYVDEILAEILSGGEIGDVSLFDITSARTKRQELLKLIESLGGKIP